MNKVCFSPEKFNVSVRRVRKEGPEIKPVLNVNVLEMALGTAATALVCSLFAVVRHVDRRRP